MPEIVLWTSKAKNELIDILQYWIERNGSNLFSKKLNRLIEEDLGLLLEFPKIGRKTDIAGVRVRGIREYLLYYEIDDKVLYVLTICHQKRDPYSITIR